MSQTNIQPISETAAWTVADFPSPELYTCKLSADEVAELAAFNQRMVEAGKGLDDIEEADFDCPLMAKRMAGVYAELKHGRGFLVMDGIPVDAWSQDDLERVYWGMGTKLGRGLSQSVMGERLGHVRDFTRDDPHARAYRNSSELNPHTDYSDLVALFCVHGAKSGGVSLLTSALSVYNTLLKGDRDVLERLIEGFYYHRRGEEGPGEEPVTPHKIPVFSDTDGKISTRWVKPFLELGQEAKGEPLNDFEKGAVARFLEVANSDALQLRFTLKPGQILWFNNLVHYHARTEFEDFEDYESRRHLMRLWLNNKDVRPKSENLALYSDENGIAYQPGKTPSYDESAEMKRLQSAQ